MDAGDNYMPLSGIQHFAFCKRQWALMHIERQWKEDIRTIEGMIAHDRAHDTKTERQGEKLIARGMAVLSHTLGTQGVCDVVEFLPDAQGVRLSGKHGADGVLYLPVPVEYKVGRPKTHDADELQLCAQGICLEEMLLCKVPLGYLYYGETKRRLEVIFTDELRNKVRDLFI